eukprot:189429-Chlamydomonas_euryale.AAC.2
MRKTSLFAMPSSGSRKQLTLAAHIDGLHFIRCRLDTLAGNPCWTRWLDTLAGHAGWAPWVKHPGRPGDHGHRGSNTLGVLNRLASWLRLGSANAASAVNMGKMDKDSAVKTGRMDGDRFVRVSHKQRHDQEEDGQRQGGSVKGVQSRGFSQGGSVKGFQSRGFSQGASVKGVQSRGQHGRRCSCVPHAVYTIHASTHF